MPPPEPPYLRIAADLKQRIQSGALKPGDRLPSTRQLAKERRVALATAAHALKTLADEGVVEALPRVGTVVAGGRGRRTPEVNRDAVVRAAMAIADAEGLSALSIRGVAAKVGVAPMSLYGLVGDKEALLAQMTERAFAEEPLPEAPPEDWREQLTIASRLEWRIFRRHPWLARVVHLSRPQPLPSLLAYVQWVMRALSGLGLSAGEMMQIHVLLHCFVQGLAVNVEAEAEAVGESGIDGEEYMERLMPAFRAQSSRSGMQHFARVLRQAEPEFELAFDDLFELGLANFLDGLDTRLRRKARTRAIPGKAGRGSKRSPKAGK